MKISLFSQKSSKLQNSSEHYEFQRNNALNICIENSDRIGSLKFLDKPLSKFSTEHELWQLLRQRRFRTMFRFIPAVFFRNNLCNLGDIAYTSQFSFCSSRDDKDDGTLVSHPAASAYQQQYETNILPSYARMASEFFLTIWT